MLLSEINSNLSGLPALAVSGTLSGWLTFHSALAGNRLLQGSQGL